MPVQLRFAKSPFPLELKGDLTNLNLAGQPPQGGLSSQARSFDSSISVTSAAIAERSERARVMCPNSG